MAEDYELDPIAPIERADQLAMPSHLAEDLEIVDIMLTAHAAAKPTARWGLFGVSPKMLDKARREITAIQLKAAEERRIRELE